MKNKFLLLSATALLSTTALLANASDLPGMSDSVADFKVTAEIVNDLNLEVIDHLNFGRIAWGSNWAESSYVEILNSDVAYNNVSFHDGWKIGKICFTDLVPSATHGTGLNISVSPIKIKSGDIEIGDVDFSGIEDAGSIDGIRCFYIGGQLSLMNNATAKSFSGEIEETTTITVLFDDD